MFGALEVLGEYAVTFCIFVEATVDVGYGEVVYVDVVGDAEIFYTDSQADLMFDAFGTFISDGDV